MLSTLASESLSPARSKARYASSPATRNANNPYAHGLVLVVVGIFSRMAYTVSLRTPEIGIRMAFGAGHANALHFGVIPFVPGVCKSLCNLHSSNASFSAGCIGNTLTDASVLVAFSSVAHLGAHQGASPQALLAAGVLIASTSCTAR